MKIPIISGIDKDPRGKNQQTWKRFLKEKVKKVTKSRQGSSTQTKKRKTKLADNTSGVKKQCKVGYTIVEDNESDLASVGEDQPCREL